MFNFTTYYVTVKVDHINHNRLDSCEPKSSGIISMVPFCIISFEQLAFVFVVNIDILNIETDAYDVSGKADEGSSMSGIGIVIPFVSHKVLQRR